MAKDNKGIKSMIEKQCLFDGFVLNPKESRNVYFDSRSKYFDKGVVFDFNLGCDSNTNFNFAKKALSLKQEVVVDNSHPWRSSTAAFYKPATFDELVNCLQNTKYTAFSKFLCGYKTELNFVKFIDSFVKNNLQEKVDAETISSYTTEIYSLITEEKGPQLYASKMESFEQKISEVLSKREEFISSYQGEQPSVEDYAFVRLVEGKSTLSGEEDENFSVEEIVRNIYLKQNSKVEDASNIATVAMEETAEQ